METPELKAYTIPFIGLKTGLHEWHFEVDNTFFTHFGFEEFLEANIQLEVRMEKKPTFLEFALSFNGHVQVNCDLTNEVFAQQLEGNFQFVVKFGDTFNNENEALLILPHGSHEVNIQQQVYESIVLAVPTKRIHPGVLDGSLESDILERLEALSPEETNSKNNNDTDPRWDTLKDLLTDK